MTARKRLVRIVPLVPLVLMAVALAACAAEQRAPGASAYRPLPFHSQVTVTGNDVPGPLRLREVSLGLVGPDGKMDETLTIRRGDVVQVLFKAWVNGHGQFTGHWERDGATIDRVNVFTTYGEFLDVRLGGEDAFPTGDPGRHEVRFVVESPEGGPQAAPVTYVVENAFR